ncbi:sacsin-like [Mytilus californianus]|uniref:sacsin-like n=1 Tax=Mytilus californianus TaxID=6549 RepID=UPI0022464AB5|nr:sacsin-like [Mytilus californianus]
MAEDVLEPEYDGIIRNTLIEDLNKILYTYSNDGQILKELIQNAEDAGANKIAILYDERNSNLNAKGSKQESQYSKYFEGPALIVYNNEEFSEADWKGIRRIGTSIKKLDPSKVGRFGLGFKSVFHITDYPMIMSGRLLMILDPYRDETRCCITLELSKLKLYSGMNECYDALFQVFDFGQNVLDAGYYKGTMFRFPLRKEATELSDSVYNTEKINNLLRVLKKEASLTLLFLKSLEEVSLYECMDSLDEQNPDYMVAIGGCTSEIAKQSRNTMQYKTIPDEPFVNVYELVLVTTCKRQLEDQKWLVINRLEGISDASEDLLKLATKLSYLPCVGIAVPVLSSDTFTGHIFCFLPLPMQAVSMTKLPVHINGTFALSEDRKQLKWADKFSESNKEDSVQWNELMVSTVLPKVYIDLIMEIRKRNDEHLMFRCIPDPLEIDIRFEECISKLFRNLKDAPFLYSKSGGGRWIRLQDAVFQIFAENTDEDIRETLIYTMRQYNSCLVDTKGYERMYGILTKAFGQQPQDASPQFISERLLKIEPAYKTFEEKHKLNLLVYLISSREDDLLKSLELLPLANGAFIKFATNTDSNIFVCSSIVRQLCPGIEDRLVRTVSDQVDELILRLARSGRTQLIEPSEIDVLQLISKSIEKIQGQSQDNRTLRWQKQWQLNEKWLMSVWEYLRREGVHLPHDLFILPHYDKQLESYYLLRLSQPLIVESDDRYALPASVVRCLKKIGVTVLNPLPYYINCCQEIYDKYVERPTVNGVLKLVAEVCQKHVRNFNDNVQSSDKEEFVNFIGSNYSLNSAKNVLKKLKMFNCNIPDCYVSIEDVSDIAPDDLLPVPLPNKLIKPKTSIEKSLAIHLGARYLSLTEVVETILHTYIGRSSNHNDTDKQIMMKYVIENMSLFLHNTEIKSLVRQVEFVRSENGDIRKPNELFDPTDHHLVQMFNDKRKFPQNQEITYLNILKTFGLKSSANLNATDINDVAMSIHRKASLAQTQKTNIAEEQANGLLNILMKNEHLLESFYNNIKLKDILANLKIIRPLRKPKSYPEVLQWFDCPDAFCKPNEMVDNAENLVGSTMPLFPDLPINFIQKLNPSCQIIPIAKVFEQLLLLDKSYSEMYKPEFHHFVKQIYSFLNEATVDKALIGSMKNRSVVWTGDGFCQPQKIYLNSSNDDIHLEPYLYQLPGEFIYMKDFFQRLGCKICQSPEVLVDVQEQIKQHHIQIRTEMEFRRDLRHNINILSFFKSHCHCAIDYNVLIPVETEVEHQLVLKHIDKCAYRSSHWSEDVKIIDEEEPFAVHPDISFAASIGIKSMEEHYLSDTGVLNWEQEVSLVSRIKSLLKGYRDGLSVPKELIQNADDAGATKVCFLYDERENLDCRTNLLNKEMGECQGPALWIYNNAQFSETDLRNITKVEEETKDLSKIGKFGVGFCSVYNLTDVPSFVSGNTMVFFDPQGSYLMKNKTKGMRIDMKSQKNQRMLHRWSDQFKPFKNIFGCDLSTDGGRIPHFDGTLFRLPLRTRQQSSSELSSIVYSHDEMRELLDIFIESAGNLLLFTQNVSEIEIFHLSEIDTRRKKLIFKVSRNLKWHFPLTYKENEDDEKEHNKVPVLKNCSPKNDNASVKNASFGTYQYSAEVEMKFRETGKQFHGQTGKSTKSNWMVSWASGTNECLKQSMQGIGAHMLPIAATAVMIEDKNGQRIAIPLSDAPYGFYKSSHLFCVLPLPIKTPFNFHISGSFAVTQDRNQLSIETSDAKKRCEFNWNQAVMEDAVVKSLFSLLQGLKENNIKPGTDLHLLWPVFNSHVEGLDIYKATKDGFIAELLTSNQEVIFQSDLDCWTEFSSCRMLDPQLLNSDVGNVAYKHALQYLNNQEIILIQMPDWLLADFKVTSGDSIYDYVISTEMFYEKVFFPLVNQEIIPAMDRNKLLLYAVDKNHDKINQLLINHVCFPSTRGILRKPCDIILRQSLLSKLYIPGDGYFLEFSIQQELERFELFKKLGMLYESLPDDLIIDRCASVENLSNKCVDCAMQRCKDIFEYFERYPPEMNTELVNALTKMKFVPVMIKPKDWPFEWKVVAGAEKNKSCGTKHKLKHISEKIRLPQFFTMECPENLYFDDCKELICCTKLVAYTRAICTKNINQVLQSLGLKGYAKTGIHFDHVVDQIQILISQCDKEKITCLRPVLETILKWLDFHCKTLDDESKEKTKSLLEPLQSTKCLLINEALWSPDQIAINFESTCLPDLVGINQKDTYLSRCKTLLSFLDVKDRYSTHDISKVLLRFTEKFDIKDPLDKQQVIHYCSLLNALCTALKEEKTDDGFYMPLKDGKILVPDDDNYLHPVHLLCLNDDFEIERSESMTFVCKHISPAVATILGVKSKKRKKISEHHNVMKFGQKEDLTTRIHKLLEGYPADEGIFKELLQNADDAGATEIHFVTDYNYYSSAKVFDGNFKELQGPSLLVYNNKSFSEYDLESIQLLGIGGKNENPTQTGKYGVGFNAVYHLTDAPSFITKGEKIDKGNRTLCILDPLCKYATTADKQNPGSRYFNLDGLQRTVPDVFVPYHEEDLMGDEGTIFRFPLRTEASEIWDKPIDIKHLTTLLGKFKNESTRSMFFLNHIRKVVFSRIENGQMISDYSVTVKMSMEDIRQKQAFHLKRLKVGEMIKEKQEITTEPIVQIQTIMNISVFDITRETGDEDETWFVVDRIGFNDRTIDIEVSHAYSVGELGLLPQGGVALPLSKIAPLQFSAFCVLPLPIYTGLPMHVNGHFALNHESRRNLWEDNKESLKSIWNRTLMSSVIAPSYIAAIEKRRDICKECTKNVSGQYHIRNQLETYFKYFPSLETAVDSNWKFLCIEIYHQVLENNPLFPTISEVFKEPNMYMASFKGKVDWICLKKNDSNFPAVFCLDNNQSMDPNSVVSIMKLLNLHVIDLSSGLYKEMKACKINVESVTPDIIIAFLLSHSDVNSDACKLVGLGKSIRRTTFETIWNVDRLLSFCKKSDTFDKHLSGLPLCISNDDILMEYSEATPMFVSRHCNIMCGLEEKFVNKKICHLMEVIKSPCLKKFTLQDFKILIKNVLNPSIYRESSTSLNWNPDQENIPNRDWLRNVWSFFADVSKMENSEKEDEDYNISHCLSDWSLLPVRIGQHQKLQSIGMSKKTLNMESFKTNIPLYEALQKIEMPELDTEIFWKYYANPKEPEFCEAANNVAEELLVSYSNSKDVFECFVYHLRRYKTNISEDDCSAYLEYFNDNYDTLERMYTSSEIKKSVRSIPLFITLGGYNTVIENIRTSVLLLHVLPTNIPDVGINEWANASGIVLLKEIKRIQHLHMKLGFISCNQYELYSKFIIPNFQSMPQSAQPKHLEYIRDNLLFKGIDGEFRSIQTHLIEELSKCPFLLKNNVSRRAVDFCNPHNDLFSVMCTEDKFPPYPYNGKEWEQFMELIGMKLTATPEMVVQFAKEIAEKGLNLLSGETSEKSKLLVNHLFNREKLLDELKCTPLRDVKHVRFIEPFQLDLTDQLSRIHKQYQNRVLVSFEDCTLYEDDILPLVWTSAYVLPDYVSCKSEKTKEALTLLGVDVLPNIGVVVQNLKNVAVSIQDKCSNDSEFVTEDRALFLKDLFVKHYICLQKSDITNTCLLELKTTPIVFFNDEKVCLSCEQVVLLLQDYEIIQPYLMRIPTDYMYCANLFRKLGALETTSSFHFADVLLCLHRDSLDGNSQPSILGPNEKKNILVPAVRNLFSKISSEYPVCLNCTELFLPNRQFILHSSKSLIVADNKKIENRSKQFHDERFFAGFEKLDLQFQFSANTLKMLPEELKPKFLSEILNEKLLIAIECQSGDKIQMLSQFVKTDEFIEGLLRLVLDEKLKINSHLGMDFRACNIDEEEQCRIVNQIASLKFQQVSDLETALFFDGRQVEESTERKKAFVKSVMIGDTKSLIMYCVDNVSDLQEWLSDIQFSFVKLLEKITRRGLRVNQVFIHLLLHSISNPALLSDKLDSENIVHLNYANVSSEIYPDPGTFVPPSLHYLLDNSFSDFEVNDYVAMLLYEEEENEPGQFEDANYMYAKVLRSIHNSQNHSKSCDFAQFEEIYLLDVGETEAVEVPAYKIFKFHRRRHLKSKDIVPTDNDAASSANMQSVDDTIKEVKKQFMTYLKITDETKRRLLIKRLRVTWHPDQNFGNEDYATKVFQFIENLIRDLKDGKLIDDEFNEQSRYRGEDLPKSPYFAQSPKYYQDNTRSHNTFAHGENREKVSIPRNARKWLRQATCDRDAAKAFIPHARPMQSFNWICYHCHQSAEKALKAMWYYMDANNVSHSHALSAIANGLPQELRDLASDMGDIVGYHTRMRYPDQISGDDIPSTIYSQQDADQCLRIASDIISFVSKMVK